MLNDKKLDLLRDLAEDQRKVEVRFPIGDARNFKWDDPAFATGHNQTRDSAVKAMLDAARTPICGEGITQKCETASKLGEIAFPRLVALVHHYPFSNVRGPQAIIRRPFNTSRALAGWNTGQYKKWRDDVIKVVSITDEPYWVGALESQAKAYQASLGIPTNPDRERAVAEAGQFIKDLEERLHALPDQRGTEARDLLFHIETQRRYYRDLVSTTPPNYVRTIRDIVAEFIWTRELLDSSASFGLLDHYGAIDSHSKNEIAFYTVLGTFFFGVFLPLVACQRVSQSSWWFVLFIVLPLAGHILTATVAREMLGF